MGPRGVGPRRVGPRGVGPRGVGPRRVGPRRVGPRMVGAQNFALFFPSPATVFILFSLSFGLFRGILVVFEAPGRSNMHVWSSRAVVCEPRRPGLVGQTCRFEGPGLQKHHQNSTKKTKREGEKNENCGGRGKKKSEILGGPAEGGPAEGGSGGGGSEHTHHTHPPHTHNTTTQHKQHNTTTTQHTTTQNHTTHNTQHTTHNTQHTTTTITTTPEIFAKTRNTKIGQSRFGQSRSKL